MPNQTDKHQYNEIDAAQTASKIVDRVGKNYGKYQAFEGNNYIIAKTIPEPGKYPELTVIAKGGRGVILKVNEHEFTSNLQAQDVKIFAKIEQELSKDRSIQQQSSSSGYKQSNNPAIIPKKGETEITLTAGELLKLLGKDKGERYVFENQSYLITQTKQKHGQSPELSVVAKDGRGEILRFNNQGFASKLQDKDIQKFAQMGQKISEYQFKQPNKSQAQEVRLAR